ncbi:MAG: hypothetical protein J5928_00425, partial [Firmicutes bacterium]|nr:hypothetical protein [Bacillota bacterium]
DILDTIIEWNQTKGFTYYAIQHNPDEDDVNRHTHIVFRFASPTPFEQVKKKFPFGKIERAKNVKRCIQYLVHLNDITKEQYSWNDVATNDPDIEQYKIRSDELMLKEVLYKIGKGEISEYNLTDYVDVNLFAKNRGRILASIDYYKRKILMDPNRKIAVYVLQGDSDTGKTTFAKDYCKRKGWSCVVAGSKNDPWQDYAGQDAIILDELRDYIFDISDLLKMIDPYTISSAKSRFSNKLFLGKAIIITTNVPIQDWYANVDEETRIALFRRIKKIYQFNRTNEKYVSEYYPISYSIETKSFNADKDSRYIYDFSELVNKGLEENVVTDMDDIEIVMNAVFMETPSQDTTPVYS